MVSPQTDDETKRLYAEWIATRPTEVQALSREFPLGSVFDLKGETYYLLGYTENDMLIVTKTWPGEDYQKAMATKEYVCAKHLRSA